MTRAKAGRRRQRGTIDRLPSGALRVRVYGGQDRVSGKRNTLVEVIEPGPRQETRAEAARTLLLNAVDEQRSPRTSATLDQLLDRYLELHVRPFLGRTKAGAVGAEALDSHYAELRRCRDRCSGSAKRVDHRTPRAHECDDRCRPHRCRPLAPATIRYIHFVLNGAYSRGVRWRWVPVNPVEFVSPPASRRRTRNRRRRGTRRGCSFLTWIRTTNSLVIDYCDEVFVSSTWPRRRRQAETRAVWDFWMTTQRENPAPRPER